MGIGNAGTFRIGDDLEVNRLGFGAMRITGKGIWGDPPDRAKAHRVLRRAVDVGVELIDTADSYGPEVSEYLIAEALHPYPEGLVVATKGGLVRGGPNDWVRDGRPDHLERALNNSLRRLRLERIDVYQLHAPDPNVPFEASVTRLAKLREAGKIRHVALSNVSVAQLDQARSIVPIVSVQNRFNLCDRKHEAVLDHCTKERIGFIPWNPLNTGDLPDGAESTIGRIARKHGATPSQVALAWLLARSPVMLPIPGTGSVEHLEENCAAADVSLERDDLRALDELAAAPT